MYYITGPLFAYKHLHVTLYEIKLFRIKSPQYITCFIFVISFIVYAICHIIQISTYLGSQAIDNNIVPTRFGLLLYSILVIHA